MKTTALNHAHPPRPLRARRVGRAGAAMSLLVAAAAGAGLLAAPSAATLGSARVAAPQPVVLSPSDSVVDPSSRSMALLQEASRSKRRTVAPTQATRTRTRPQIVGHRYATVALKVRTAPTADAHVVDVVDARYRVSITAKSYAGWQQVIHQGQPRWVRAQYLSRRLPVVRVVQVRPKGLSKAPCASGSAVEAGLVANAVAVHRAVCAQFPTITAYGGYRPGTGYHAQGRALDIMVSGSAGTTVARWLQAHASELGIMELIYAQHIWTVQRAGEGWRPMEDRGSVTDNHYDHVHVTLYA